MDRRDAEPGTRRLVGGLDKLILCPYNQGLLDIKAVNPTWKVYVTRYRKIRC